VRQERSTLGGGEREAVTAPRWHGAGKFALPGYPGCRYRASRQPAAWSWTAAPGRVQPGAMDLGAALSPVAALSERRRQQCGLGRNGEPALQEGLAGRDWAVDRRDLAERVGNRLFHIPVPPDDQLALLLVLGDRGRDHVER